MNKQIKLLAEQARKHFPKTETSGEFWVFDEEKFTQLIVWQCGVALSPMLRDMISRGQAFDLIKEHFGVEE